MVLALLVGGPRIITLMTSRMDSNGSFRLEQVAHKE